MCRENIGGTSGSEGVCSTSMIVKILLLEFLSFDCIKKQTTTRGKRHCLQTFLFLFYY